MSAALVVCVLGAMWYGGRCGSQWRTPIANGRFSLRCDGVYDDDPLGMAALSDKDAAPGEAPNATLLLDIQAAKQADLDSIQGLASEGRVETTAGIVEVSCLPRVERARRSDKGVLSRQVSIVLIAHGVGARSVRAFEGALLLPRGNSDIRFEFSGSEVARGASKRQGRMSATLHSSRATANELALAVELVTTRPAASDAASRIHDLDGPRPWSRVVIEVVDSQGKVHHGGPGPLARALLRAPARPESALSVEQTAVQFSDLAGAAVDLVVVTAADQTIPLERIPFRVATHWIEHP